MQRMYNIASLSLMYFTMLSLSIVPTSKPTETSSVSDKEFSYLAEFDGSLNLACQDTVIVTLDPNCQFVLSPATVLLGQLPEPSCVAPEDFVILVEDDVPGNGGQVDGCGFFRYYIGLDQPLDCTPFQNCWGVIQAEDKTPPIVTAPDDVTYFLSCEQREAFINNPASLEVSGAATVKDNCDPIERPLENFNDVVSNFGPCGVIEIIRTFTATDEKGNQASDQQIIRLNPPTLEDIDIDLEVAINYACGDTPEFPTDVNGNIHPSTSGYPYFINEFEDTVRIEEAFCNLAITYEDIRFDVCPEKYKIERNWHVSDWCSGEKKSFKQTIVIGDLRAPLVDAGDQVRVFSTGPDDCTGAIEALRPQIEEACSALELITAELYHIRIDAFSQNKDTIFVEGLEITEEPTYFRNVAPGDYYITYQVIDACKNMSRDTLLARVEDHSKPIAKCTDGITVTLDNIGFGRVAAKDVDEGSSDNCQLDSLLVRRKYTFADDCSPLSEVTYSDWDEFIYLSCCDLQAPVEVSLRVVDKAGNESQCWMYVIAEDKIAPECIAPEDVEVDCDSLPANLDYSDPTQLANYFGLASGSDVCSSIIVEELTPLNELGSCGFGYVTRSWVVYDTAGNVSTNLCEQTIKVNAVHNYEIKFPKDFEAICMEPDPDSIYINELGCDLLAVFSNDDKLSAAADECYKVFRKFRVINWCEYDGISDPFVVSRDADCDGKPGDEDVWVLRRPDGRVFIDANNNELDSIPARDPDKWENCFGWEANPWGHWYSTDSFPELTSNGFWEYTQIIKVIDTIAPVIFFEDSVFYCMNRADCSADVVVSFNIVDECVDGNVRIETYFEGINNEFHEMDEDPWDLVGRYPKYLMSGVIPEGRYRVEIIADDQCGNGTRVEYFLEIVDCKAPPLICEEGLVVELMRLEAGTDFDGDGDDDLGGNTIWVDDLLRSLEDDDCSGPATYSINRKGETPDPNQQSLALTCDDGGFVDVEIYGWDQANNPYSVQPDGTIGGPNYDFCRTTIELQDNQGGFCNEAPPMQIAGRILAPNAEGVANVEVALSGNSAGAVMSRADGRYSLTNVQLGNDYTVIPNKEDELLKGVSTLDIIYMSKHILGIRLMQSPFQLLAADINRSGGISTLDIILLRKAILQVDQRARELAGWRFLDAEYIFNDPQEPWAAYLPAILNINNLDRSVDDADFIAIKMGDVSNNGIGARSFGKADQINIVDQYVEAGESVSFSVNLSNLNQLEGFQFALNFDEDFMQEMVLRAGICQEEHMAMDIIRSGQLAVSWDKYSSKKVLNEKMLFEVSFVAAHSGYLSEYIDLNDRNFQANTFSENTTSSLSLNWLETAPDTDWDLSVFPNPFTGIVQAKLFSSTSGRVNYEILQINGTLVKSGVFDVQEGENRIAINDLGHLNAGVYFLRINGLGMLKTEKIVKL